MAFHEVNEPELAKAHGAALLLEHPRLPFLSMPYEWSFSLLKDAAIFHLDLQLGLLEQGFTLSDASAYNIQFIGHKPIFIDHLSIQKYQEGSFWLGHRQFCEQFLNPLLLRALVGIGHNAWYRGELEGVRTTDIAKILPISKTVNWNVLTNVILPAKLQEKATSDRPVGFTTKNRSLPLVGLVAILKQLRRWITKLRPADTSPTTWANYAKTTSYSDEAMSQKLHFVQDFVRLVKPATLIDLGCNTGDYSEASLAAGASNVIGFDFDLQALDGAHQRAKAGGWNFLPLYLDAANPSPSQGWRQKEREGFSARFKADAVLALAFEHHLTIAKNAPIDEVIRWITDLAPRGVVEFVPKSDPTVQKMLALREDIFDDYSVETFERCLSSEHRITKREVVAGSDRVLFAYEARGARPGH